MNNGLIDQQEKSKRNLFLRMVFGIVWLIPISFITNIIVGAIVGTTASAPTQNWEAGYAAGYAASTSFFQKYGLVVFLAQILLTALLSFFGILPATGKFKRKKNT